MSLPEKEIIGKPIKARKVGTCINTPILGHRDPRGPDNNIRVWVDENDQLHIRVERANRCYKYARTLIEDGFIEIIAN